jgi:hypothetical protein
MVSTTDGTERMANLQLLNPANPRTAIGARITSKACIIVPSLNFHLIICTFKGQPGKSSQ